MIWRRPPIQSFYRICQPWIASNPFWPAPPSNDAFVTKPTELTLMSDFASSHKISCHHAWSWMTCWQIQAFVSKGFRKAIFGDVNQGIEISKSILLSLDPPKTHVLRFAMNRVLIYMYMNSTHTLCLANCCAQCVILLMILRNTLWILTWTWRAPQNVDAQVRPLTWSKEVCSPNALTLSSTQRQFAEYN